MAAARPALASTFVVGASLAESLIDPVPAEPLLQLVTALDGVPRGIAMPLFSALIATCECIPFFPTQPLSILAGLLFGVVPGVATVIAGTTGAAILGFSISRGPGRKFAELIIQAEEEPTKRKGKGGEGGGLKANVQGVLVRARSRQEGIRPRGRLVFAIAAPSPEGPRLLPIGLPPHTHPSTPLPRS